MEWLTTQQFKNYSFLEGKGSLNGCFVHVFLPQGDTGHKKPVRCPEQFRSSHLQFHKRL